LARRNRSRPHWKRRYNGETGCVRWDNKLEPTLSVMPVPHNFDSLQIGSGGRGLSEYVPEASSDCYKRHQICATAVHVRLARRRTEDRTETAAAKVSGPRRAKVASIPS